MTHVVMTDFYSASSAETHLRRSRPTSARPH